MEADEPLFTEELPLAEDLQETPSDLKAMLTELLKSPTTHVICAILDYLEENSRHEDRRELLRTLSTWCSLSYDATSPIGRRNVAAYWQAAAAHIRQIFWFDLHNMLESLESVCSECRLEMTLRAVGVQNAVSEAVEVVPREWHPGTLAPAHVGAGLSSIPGMLFDRTLSSERLSYFTSSQAGTTFQGGHL